MILKKIKSIIKRGPFCNIATRIGDFYSDPHIISKLYPRKLPAKTAILIGTPAHHNLGDHLIAENEILFLKEYCGFEKIIEIPTRVFQSNRKRLIKIYNKDIPIFITGGGWMGDVWPEDEKNLEDFIRSYSNHKIVIFPQTIYYNNKRDMLGAIKHTKSVFALAKDLTIMCRDEKSYNIAKRFLVSDSTEVFLLPDMGLLKRNENNSKYTNIALYCFRNDREQIYEDKLYSELRKIIKESNLIIENTSTVLDHAIPLWKRSNELKKTKRKFGSASVVITDRLHGMVFAVITGSKCIALDNKTHKVEGVYNAWLKNNCNVICFANSIDVNEFQKTIFNMLNNIPNESSWYNKVSIGFAKMAEIINGH